MCLEYRRASCLTRAGCPAVLVYWCGDDGELGDGGGSPVAADTSDWIAKPGGGQSGKPCPRFAMSIPDSCLSLARRPNSDHTVGPECGPSRRIAPIPGAPP